MTPVYAHILTYMHLCICTYTYTQLVFEDSPSGARAGAQSGAFTIGVLSSQKAEALTEVSPIGVVLWFPCTYASCKPHTLYTHVLMLLFED